MLQIKLGNSSGMTPIIDFFTNDSLPKNIAKATRMRLQESFYSMYKDEHFQRGFFLSIAKMLEWQPS